MNNKPDRVNERVQSLVYLLDKYEASANIDTYLDLGCGDAKIYDQVIATLKPKKSYCCDIVEIDHPHFIQIKDGKIPLPDSSVSLVTLYVVVHHFTEPHLSLEEIRRVLKPNGFVFIREHDVVNEEDGIFLDFVHLIDYFAKVIGEGDVQQSVSKYRQNHPTYYYSRTDLIKLMAAHNLKHLADRDYDIPNPQRLYHSLFTASNGQTVELYPNHPGSIDNLILSIRNGSTDLKAKYSRHLYKRLKINRSSANMLLSSEDDSIFIHRLISLIQEKAGHI